MLNRLASGVAEKIGGRFVPAAAAAKRLRIVALLSLLGTGITAANARVIIERAFPNGTAAQPLGPEW